MVSRGSGYRVFSSMTVSACGEAGPEVLLEHAPQHHREHLVVLGELVAELLLGLRGVQQGVERPDHGLDLAPADAAVVVDPVDQRRDLRRLVALVGEVELQGLGQVVVSSSR